MPTPTSIASPRVLFLVTEDWYFWSHRLPIARALRDAGFKVGIACRVTDHGERITAEGFHLLPLKFSRRSINPFHVIKSIYCIVRTYRSFRPDIVHHVAIKPALLGSLAARIAAIPMRINAIAGLGFVFAARTLRARALRPLVLLGMRILLDSAHSRTIVQNEDDGRALVNRQIVGQSRLRLIRGSGVDLTRFHPAPEPAAPIRATLVARMIAEKGIAEMVEAARILKSRNVDIRITLAGETDAENPSAIPLTSLQGWADENIIEYMGRVEDVPNLWAESHIAVLPSYYGEGVPLALIEAAASGRPMIAADGPGLRDIVRDGETGILIPPRDASALADAIEKLATDAQLRHRMGTAARALADKAFGTETVAAQTLEIYRELLGDRWPTS